MIEEQSDNKNLVMVEVPLMTKHFFVSILYKDLLFIFVFKKIDV